MTVYNINLALGWASSGVEYAQLYRADSFRKINQDALFIFTEFFNDVNFQHFAENIGFKDQEAVWMYQALTDMPTHVTTFTLEDLEATFAHPIKNKEVSEKQVKYHFEGVNQFVTAFLCKEDKVFCAEYVTRGYLVRKDYYIDRKYFTEYFAPKDGKAEKYARHFYNQDGSIAYEEIIQGQDSIFRINQQVLHGRLAFLRYYLQSLNLTKEDIVLIDRASKIGPTILKYARPAKIGCVIHAEHYSYNATNKEHILWNNFYEYLFTHHELVDFYIASTQMQADTLQQQFKYYNHIEPRIYAIPVGNLEKLTYPDKPRRPYSLITASRLAGEKNIDQLILAVVDAKKHLPALTFDIYGKGGKENELRALIAQNNAQNYIHLKGHHQLSEVYKNYETYISASGSEGFGLTLMEAVGSGLCMVGYDVPYGNPTFIEEGKNGYLIERTKKYDQEVKAISKAIQKLHGAGEVTQSAHEASYDLAKDYLIDSVAKMWQKLIKEESAR
ncbi:accessory Sec system glycosyltransferase GtfA [Enterococcus cecorum]|uniref:accessory Sec system glycosyltransferase GtfA n=1 Tax=Enterococcus cecorum TaxID=44008 RepID=UPI0025A3988E|nr:accessory Sec system glycosyltransferase GtfA [Enterococcus cecorum]MDM8182623.1 accessory Sec system glycosyltransferase GtfA [Enterococcus cecorum]